MSLKTDFKNDKFAGKRKYTLTENDDGTISLDDVTEYETVGDIYGEMCIRDSNSAAVWYPHVLSGVHLETDRGQIIKKYGPESTDNAELHIAYTEKNGQKIITDTAGKELIWLPPKAWAKQVNDDLANSITRCV